MRKAPGRKASGRKALPRLLFFTDPARTPEPEAIAATLPRGAAIVFRPFGATDAEARARRLKAIARQRGLILLIGADARLARRVAADGVHLPQRLAHRARALRTRNPGWIVTAAAHDERAVHTALTAGADAAILSTAFPSQSPSAGRPLGPVRLAAIARRAPGPVYALGGLNDRTAGRLNNAGLAGLAAVEALDHSVRRLIVRPSTRQVRCSLGVAGRDKGVPT